MFRTTALITCTSTLALTGAARAGLVAYYSLDETGGAVAHDAVGGINGALQGAAAFVPGGISGNALSLARATNDLVNMGNNFGFASGPFSTVAWIKLAPGNLGSMTPVAKHEAGFLNGYILAANDINDGHGGGARSHFYDSGGFTGNSPQIINDGEWHQLVGIFDGSNTLLYVDGVFAAAGGGAAMVTNTASFMIGGVNVSGVPTGNFDGLIDEVRLFDHALSAQEVSDLYHNVPSPAGLVVIAGGGLVVAGRRRR